MRIRAILLCIVAFSCTQPGLGWCGQILETIDKQPSDLYGPNTGSSNVLFRIACTDAYTGLYVSCGYRYNIEGLKQPNDAVANNGGHTHNIQTHPLGKVKIVLPTMGSPSTDVSGSTNNSFVVLNHDIPDVSGIIQTRLDLTVPPGWYTVYPESCYGNFASWCYITTIDVGVRNLAPLPDNPSLYIKVRNADTNHTDAVAYYGTDTALNNLSTIAAWYKRVSLGFSTLSINDMSLIKGGLFDIDADYLAPHSSHRRGRSADINKSPGVDCRNNKLLLLSTLIVMRDPNFKSRKLPSFGHYLCETGNRNNIHIDL
jgi:hypothetical protein